MDTSARLSAALADRYVVERLVGAGGMASVYLARDVKHHRKVALKVLKPELGAVLGVERFLSEIQVTANLQHPNLLPLFDSGEAEGMLFYVMPFVEGETLRARLEREKQLPLDVALHIATATASALDYAHRQGVIHRDLKPENILLQDGEPVVADFGIALAVSNAGGNRITQTGLSLGTPQYMSPEQATGDRAVDARTDIYSLGAMLYEMLSGEPPHIGNTAQAIIARVLTEKPRSVRVARPAIPEHVAAAVETALEKLPADRFASARDFAEALQGRGVATTKTSAAGATASPALRGVSWKTAAPWIVSALAIAAAVSTRLGSRAPAVSIEPPTGRFIIPLPPGYTVTGVQNQNALALAPDGSRIVVNAARGDSSQLFSRTLDALDWTPIPGTSGAGSPGFGRDAHTLFFVRRSRMYRLSDDGSLPTEVAQADFGAPSVGDDGSMYLTRTYSAGISRLRPDGSLDRELTKPDSARRELGHWWPQVIPGAGALVFGNYASPLTASTIEVLELRSGKRTVLVKDYVSPRYADGLLFFGRGGVLYGAPFDTRGLRLTAPPAVVQQGVAGTMSNGSMDFRVSRDGTLAYIPEAVADPKTQLVWVTRQGVRTPAFAESGQFKTPRLSPDGKRVAFTIEEEGEPNVWVYDFERGVKTRITDRQADTPGLDWSADGRALFYSTETPVYDVFRRPSDAAAEESLVIASRKDKIVNAAFRDGKTLLVEHSAATGYELATVDIATRSLRPLFPIGITGLVAAASPDGRWLAYLANESGKTELFVRSYPDVNAMRRKVGAAAASAPRWTKNGREIVFSDGQNMIAVSFDPATGEIGRSERLFDNQAMTGTANFDVTADGQRFLIVERPVDVSQYVVVVTNWLASVRKKFGAR